jgi:pilus assembly protein Flp/PilA
MPLFYFRHVSYVTFGTRRNPNPPPGVTGGWGRSLLGGPVAQGLLSTTESCQTLVEGLCSRIHGSEGIAPISLEHGAAMGFLRSYRIGKCIFRFARDESGATAIEYGLIAAGISVAIIVAVQTLGTNLNTTLTSVSNALK